MTMQAQRTREGAEGGGAEGPGGADGASSWDAYLGQLDALADALTAQGLRARLVTPPGRVPSLHVVNPAASALAEDVYAGRGDDGQWWFWWSWAERIASGEDLTDAASRIARVLAARD